MNSTINKLLKNKKLIIAMICAGILCVLISYIFPERNTQVKSELTEFEYIVV